MTLTMKQALAAVGGIGKAGKMPCATYGIRAGDACGVGSILRLIPGSTCFRCYADGRGSYAWDNVSVAHRRRESTFGVPSGSGWRVWVRAFARITARKPLFRWFDSGDVRNYAHLCALVRVAERSPGCRFWLPTREYALVSAWLRKHPRGFPRNLTVRVSAPMVDGPAPNLGVPTSRTHAKAAPVGFACPAAGKAGAQAKCRTHDCTRCWDADVPCVSYALH